VHQAAARADPLGLQPVGSEHLDRFLASVERVNAETEHRLSDEGSSHTGLEVQPAGRQSK
jgi:hypothetical protein